MSHEERLKRMLATFDAGGMADGAAAIRWMLDRVAQLEAENARLQPKQEKEPEQQAEEVPAPRSAARRLRPKDQAKRQRVLDLLKDPVWAQRSTQWIAEHLGLNWCTVNLVRKLYASGQGDTRVTRSGRTIQAKQRIPRRIKLKE